MHEAAHERGTRRGRSPSAGLAPTVGVVAPRGLLQRLLDTLGAGGFDTVTLGSRSAPRELDALVLAVSAPAEGADALRRARERHRPGVVVLVAHHATPAEGRQLLVDGVAGLVLEDRASEALAPAVRSALAGQVSYPVELMPSSVRAALSTREKQILGMVVLGFSNAEIAAKLYVTESTVKSHLSSAFATLGVRSRRDAVALILDPEAGFGTGILAITDST